MACLQPNITSLAHGRESCSCPWSSPDLPSLCWRGQPSPKRQLVSMGSPWEGLGAGPGTCAPKLVESVGLLGKGWRDSFSGSLLCVWMLIYLPVCHFTLQDCWSGNGWLVGVNGCPQWFKPNNRLIGELFPAQPWHLPCCSSGPLPRKCWCDAVLTTWSRFSSQPTAKDVPVTSCYKALLCPKSELFSGIQPYNSLN